VALQYRRNDDNFARALSGAATHRYFRRITKTAPGG